MASIRMNMVDWNFHKITPENINKIRKHFIWDWCIATIGLFVCLVILPENITLKIIKKRFSLFYIFYNLLIILLMNMWFCSAIRIGSIDLSKWPKQFRFDWKKIQNLRNSHHLVKIKRFEDYFTGSTVAYYDTNLIKITYI